GAEELAAGLDEPLRLLGRLDVLDDPAVGAVVAAGVHVVDEAVEGAARGAHALDREDLALDREDRLDLQRRAEHGLRLADSPAALQVLERVDGEPDLQLLAHAAHRVDHAAEVRARARRTRGAEDEQPEPPAGRPGGDDPHAPRVPAPAGPL